MAEKKNMTLSQAMDELEKTVALLEEGQELEKATELYEKAMKLSVYCSGIISQAKKKISGLSSEAACDE